jgi:hypothetical protein
MGRASVDRRVRARLAAAGPILLVAALALLAQGLFAEVLPRPSPEPQAAPPAPRTAPGRSLDDDDLART